MRGLPRLPTGMAKARSGGIKRARKIRDDDLGSTLGPCIPTAHRVLAATFGLLFFGGDFLLVVFTARFFFCRCTAEKEADDC